MTILSTHESSRIRNAALSALHYIAYDQHCEVSDILALITASQPAPAAVTPAAEPADMQAEEVPPVASPATPSPEPQPISTPAVQAHDVEPSSEVLDVTSHSLPGAERAADRAPISPSRQEETLGEEATAPRDKAAAGKTVRSKGLAASLQKSVKQQVRDLHAEHPDWSSRQIAAALPDCNPQTISVALSDIRGEERAAEDIATQTRLIAEAAERSRQPLKTEPGGRSLGERVKALHRQKPNWNARMIANELGAPLNSVRTMLSTTKAEDRPVAPEFAGKAALQDHYAEVGKRLGKAS